MSIHGVRALLTSVLSVALLMPLIAAASDVRVGQQPSLTANEKITSNVYLAGGSVSSSATVPGDEVVAGGSVLVNGPISQDLLAAGGNVTILSPVGGDVRVAGGNLTIVGAVKGDVAAVGGQTQISGTGVGGDVLWAGGTLRVDAPVNGTLHLRGGNVTINAPVKGDIDFNGGTLTLGNAAVVEGNLVYTADKQADIQTGAVVRGKTTFEPRKNVPEAAKVGILVGLLSFALFVKFLMTLISALVLGLVFRRYALTVVENAAARPLAELGRGFATLILLPVASVILLVTVVGLPIGILGLIGFVALMIVASILSAIVLGSIVHRLIWKPHSYEVSWRTILLGAILYFILGLIPFVGWLAKFVLILITLGAIAKVKQEVVREWR